MPAEALLRAYQRLHDARDQAGLERLFAPDGDLGPCLWTRSHTFVWHDEAHRQHERFYLVPLPDPVELVSRDQRWWRLDELRDASEVFAPRMLPELTARLLRDGPPDTPIDVGV